ncbi:PG0541 family transporter-associated protein [Bacteroidota bacterium]
MKSIFIIYNQAHTEKIDFMLDKLHINGFSQWTDMKGRGTDTGNPHMGTHTWPEINSATMIIVEDEKVDFVLESIKSLDEINKDVGIRAFVWDIIQSV